MNRNRPVESGVAIIVAVMAALLVSALGAVLILLTMSETTTAASFVRSSEAAYAADAIAERVLADLAREQDWTRILNGSVRSVVVDGTPNGTRTLEDGSLVDLLEVKNVANCEKVTACSASAMDAVTSGRPWGPNNPRWQLYAYGPLDTVLPPGAAHSPFYVVVMVGDDPAENDDNPTVDGGAPATGELANPGAGSVGLRAEAFGPGGAHGRVDLAVRRSVRVLSWREVP